MPILRVELLDGRDPSALSQLGASLTKATADTLSIPEERVRVIISPTPAGQWFVGGQSLAKSKE